jgi:hypothetical protein
MSSLSQRPDLIGVVGQVRKVPSAVVEDSGTSRDGISSTSTPIRVLLGGVSRMT